MIVECLAYIGLAIALFLFGFAWKRNVAVSKKVQTEKSNISFYDDSREFQRPTYSSNYKNLDTHVSGAVRYNQSMYYSQEEFESFKEMTVKKHLPV